MSSTSSQPSRSSPSPSSSSSTNRHPNSPLPKLTRNPLKPPAQTAFTTLSHLLAPLGSQSIVSSTQTPEPPETPEKCLTFCSQRHNAPPLCRMLCLRRRNPQLSQKEQIARLRPQRRASSTTSDEATTFTSPTISFLSSFSPFESLRRRLEPYSFVFIRGTPNGVVGRYMEEMEHDDGQYDSGTKSRGAGHLHRRKRADTGVKFLDWGDHGLVHRFLARLTISTFLIIQLELILCRTGR